MTKRTKSGCCLEIARPYGSSVSVGAHDLGERVLRREPVQDRVVGGDRRHLALLQQDQAVGPVGNLDDLRVRRVVRDGRHRVGAGGRAHLLAAEVGQAVARESPGTRTRWCASK